MSNPRYPAEMRERAVKMVMEVRRESGQDKGAIARVAAQLGIGREALRGWVAQAEVNSGARPGMTSDDKVRIRELERENSELRRANEILKAASAYFARELDPRLPRLSSSLTRTGAGSASSRPVRSWDFPCRRITMRRAVRSFLRRGRPVMPC